MADSARLKKILDVVVAAHGGDYSQRISLEEIPDDLLEVEVGINFLLDELAMREQEAEAHRESIAAQAAQLADQTTALIRALSTPIITLSPGVLALPLIGDFDDQRAEDTTAILLARVARERASHVILDLTGVESVSPTTASAILRMIRTARLLGVTCLVTGIHPTAALQFAELEPDPDLLQTHANVSDALALVLRDTSRR